MPPHASHDAVSKLGLYSMRRHLLYYFFGEDKRGCLNCGSPFLVLFFAPTFCSRKQKSGHSHGTQVAHIVEHPHAVPVCRIPCVTASVRRAIMGSPCPEKMTGILLIYDSSCQKFIPALKNGLDNIIEVGYTLVKQVFFLEQVSFP